MNSLNKWAHYGSVIWPKCIINVNFIAWKSKFSQSNSSLQLDQIPTWRQSKECPETRQWPSRSSRRRGCPPSRKLGPRPVLVQHRHPQVSLLPRWPRSLQHQQLRAPHRSWSTRPFTDTFKGVAMHRQWLTRTAGYRILRRIVWASRSRRWLWGNCCRTRPARTTRSASGRTTQTLRSSNNSIPDLRFVLHFYRIHSMVLIRGGNLSKKCFIKSFKTNYLTKIRLAFYETKKLVLNEVTKFNIILFMDKDKPNVYRMKNYFTKLLQKIMHCSITESYFLNCPWIKPAKKNMFEKEFRFENGT